MTSTAVRLSMRAAVDAMRAANDAALVAELGTVEDDELLELLRAWEVERRRFAAVDARVVGEIDARGLGSSRGARDTTRLLSVMLRVDPGEAKARVRAGQDFTTRRTLTGASLEPALPQVAAALADGAIHPRQAALIAHTIDALPVDVQATKDRQIEADLLAQARQFAPHQLAQLCRRMSYLYDQDGTLADDTDRNRRREFTVQRHPDGSATGQFRLDPTTAEALDTVLDAKLAATSADERGTRTPAQLRHDAFRDLIFLLLRTGQLPTTAGVTTTIVVHLTLQQWATALTLAGVASASSHPDPTRERVSRRTCSADDTLAVTNHGALLTLHEVAPLVGDAQVMAVIFSGAAAARRVEAYGDKHRIFTENQRLALAARDHGCTFPGCTSTPAYCEAHHIIDYAAGGPTSISNATLLCGYHHRHFRELGYRCRMIDDVPHWIAPTWIDPTQTPIRNTAHHPAHAPP